MHNELKKTSKLPTVYRGFLYEGDYLQLDMKSHSCYTMNYPHSQQPLCYNFV